MSFSRSVLIFLICARVHHEDKCARSAQSTPLQSSGRRLRKGLTAGPGTSRRASRRPGDWQGFHTKDSEAVFIHFDVRIISREFYVLQDNKVLLAFRFHSLGAFPHSPPEVWSRLCAHAAATPVSPRLVDQVLPTARRAGSGVLTGGGSQASHVRLGRGLE